MSSVISEATLERWKASRRNPGVQRLAPAFDFAIMVAFVALGERSHDLHANLSSAFAVLWPLVLGWFGAALVFRVYSTGGFSWPRALLTWTAGMSVALILRVVVTHRPAPLPFVIVLLAFTGLTTLGWRLCEWWLSSFRADTPAGPH